MALLFLGKLLIAVGLVYQAYQLYENKATALAFDAHLSGIFAIVGSVPAEIQDPIKQYGRLVVAFLLSVSSLAAVFRTCLFKIPVIIGLIALLIVRHFPIVSVPSFKDQEFWQLVAIIGGYIYLLGAESCSGNKKCNVQKQTQAKKP